MTAHPERTGRRADVPEARRIAKRMADDRLAGVVLLGAIADDGWGEACVDELFDRITVIRLRDVSDVARRIIANPTQEA